MYWVCLISIGILYLLIKVTSLFAFIIVTKILRLKSIIFCFPFIPCVLILFPPFFFCIDFNASFCNLYWLTCCCSVAQLCQTPCDPWMQHARLPCPSPSPAARSNSCPLSQWCHSAILYSVIPFSSCLQSFPESGSFPIVNTSHQMPRE